MSAAPPSAAGNRRLLPLLSGSSRAFGAGAAALVLLAAAPAPAAAPGRAAGPGPDPASLVNPLIGTAGVVHTFPGPVVPFGMMQLGPDTTPLRPYGGGYGYSAGRLSGFSLTHLSGPGCPAAGDVPLLPVSGGLPADPGSASVGFSHRRETVRTGLYRVTDDGGVTTELAAAARAGIARFTFPAGKDARLLLKLRGGATRVDSTRVRFVSDREITGSVRSGHFCGADNTYTLHFAITFDRPLKAAGTWRGRRQQSVHGPAGTDTQGADGAYAAFDTSGGRTVTARIGISYTSRAGALGNLRREAANRDVHGLEGAAHAAWNRVLGRLRVTGGTRDQQVQFYTALYHALLHPNVFSDTDGRYPGMDRKVHTVPRGHAQYANFSGWDTYRTQAQLMALVDPAVASDMVSSMLRDFDQGGSLPKWAQNNGESWVMIGDPADGIIAGAYAFGARSFDARRALAVMVREAVGPNHARPGQAVRDRLGYLPVDGRDWGCCHFYGTVSTQLEYDNADYAVAAFARALGDRATYTRFATRAQDWQNLFNRASGYLQPRLAAGGFAPGFTPGATRGFVEGTSAQYTPMVAFNLRRLIEGRGGRRAWSAYLDSLLRDLRRPTPTTADLNNEPSIGIPWQYDWTGEPWKTQRAVRRVQRTLWSDTPGGQFGNDDLGAMSSWYVWSMLGLYPAVPGSDLLVLGSPAFPEVTVSQPGAAPFTVLGRGASAGGPYVHALTLGGRSHPRPWLTFRELRGRTLAFTLGATPAKGWGAASAPPSDATGQRPWPRR
ncbi:GH92 family glycosyl hydrolase [Streptacidiphilus griseoplanus]|uniref:GH92 family glycosyl hydrolase n=1 Tax=Peterkaempfera griseoplana TaxID=66896 RepID=UPI0006E136F3|nr:GH92 family glycosyl hydrolase [Peterkaempfera griseoplana]